MGRSPRVLQETLPAGGLSQLGSRKGSGALPEFGYLPAELLDDAAKQLLFIAGQR